MLKRASEFGLCVVAIIVLSAPAWSQRQLAAEHAKTITFDNKEILADWTITGDVTIDQTKGRESRNGSLKVGPGGKALLKLRERDESGKVEVWVFDDGTTPKDIKASRLGPRWGLVQSDGKLLAVGVIYASYLGGAEGYTATACNGRDWFNQLFWLGVNRAPAGWHKWTFDFDAADGLQVLHNDREVTAVDSAKVGLQGFSAVAIWGDAGQGNAQTIWLTDLSVTLGGPVKIVPRPDEVNPYDEKAIASDPDIHRPKVIYTPDNAPPVPKIENLPLKDSVSQYGMTWTFDKPVRVGQFINGDWYVIGPVTLEAIDPKPLYGSEIPRRELDRTDKERKEEHRVRNGFMLNPAARMEVAYDSGIQNWFTPSLIQRLPVTIKPGDSLVSTISMPKNLVLHAQLRNKIERGVEDSSPIRTAAVLTCVSGPQPPDAFRPAFCDRQQKIYLSRNLKRDLLPRAAATPAMPKIEQYIRFTQRPWVGTCFFGFEEPVENMPQYGLEYGRVAGISALLLCTDLKPELKEPLLVNYVQVGIDLGGMVRAGHPGWTGFGGHGSGRKLPIIFAGLLLGDDELAHINRSFSKASFGEDEQTAYGDSWTGAKVVFAGHSGIDAATGKGRSRDNGWGPYEHTPPTEWKDGANTSESYRRCCTSVGWVAQALAVRLMGAEKSWNHDPFFDYVDRWMYEDDAAFVKTIKEATGRDHDKDWARQGQAWDAFVNEMWAKHRATLQAPTDCWKKQHDDSYYRKAIGELSVTAVALPAGVKAVWDLDKSYHETTQTRERICINGLWLWQPSLDDSLQVPTAAWGYYKVPACWPGNQDYLQSDYQTLYANPKWTNTKLSEVQSAWYERSITIPQDWAGRRIALDVEYLNSYAVIYVDRQKMGEIRFPAGQVDISTAVRPGSTHVLSLLVVAMPLKAVMESYNDTNTAKQRKGSVERRGLCGDLWLIGEPVGARLSDVRIDTSFRQSQISFNAGLQGLTADGRYQLRAQISDQGRQVAEFTGPVFSGRDLKDGRATFTASWKPPMLWDINTPQNQYAAELSLLDADGQVVDRAMPIRFGFREFWIQGRDFYLNGTRLYLSLVPLDNAQVGAALATYAGAKESLLRLKSFGINFVYTHNYGCEPGAHLSFAEILRAADDTGMLVALSQPHFSAYDWKSSDADQTNGYGGHAGFYMRVAGNHPSVVGYAMSHNATGYNEDVNPLMMDGVSDPRDQWAARNAGLALRCETIVKHLDPARIVYHHSSGNLSAMYTLNFYPNFVPIQELDDWFEHWSSAGDKPMVLVEYGAPFGWDWTMYRGWYNGQREFGSAAVPWEYCIAEWNAQFLGDAAYQISDREKRNLRWEAQQFREGHAWYRWDYPYPVGDAQLDELHPVQAAYTTNNWRAFRTWGLSANSPWEHDRFWKLRDGFQHRCQDLPVDWDNLQQPGYSPDFIDRTYARFDLAYERSDWVASPTAKSLFRNNLPLLAWIAGKPEHFTTKDHTFYAGETIDKQLIVINNSRLTVTCDTSWSADLRPAVGGTERVVLPTGEQMRIPVHLKLPAELVPGNYQITASFRFSTGESQEDSFMLQVIPHAASPRPVSNIAIFDPPGQTTQLLAGLGVTCQPVGAADVLSGFDMLLIGKGALSVDGPAPVLKRVRDGLKVVVFEQTAEVLEKRLGFRVEEYGLRQVWPRVPDSQLLAGLTAENLRDWRGFSTLLPPTMAYTLSPRYSGAPTVHWCGLEVTRLWRCGNWGNVASVLIEKPPRGDFLPIVDGGYALQYSPLLEYREGRGMVLFCQMDLTGRTESDPAAETLAGNILRYVDTWHPSPRRTAVYAGEPTGLAWLTACGVETVPFKGEPPAADQVLVVGPGGGREIGAKTPATDAWLKAGGSVLALGLDQEEANSFLLTKVIMQPAEHIATWFPPFSSQSLLAGVAPADMHNRDPRKLPLVVGDATAYGDGVLAATGSVVFCQLPPFQVSKTMGALSSLTVTEDSTGDHKKCALVSMGSLVSAQFGQKITAGQMGKTYTFAAWVKALGGPAVVRLEVERAGRPWDRAARGTDITISPSDWTEVHLTFAVDKAYPEGWQAYLNGLGEGAKFQVNGARLYEGPYVPNSDPASLASEASDRNFFKNANFEAGLASWYFNHGPEQFNLRRTFGRTSFAVGRLLGNLGVSGSTPLLERFGDPVGASKGPSVVKNGDFSTDANGDGLADAWEFGANSKGATCTREALPGPGGGWAQLITVPPVSAGAKAPEVMIAQHEMPIQGGQWYRLSLRTRADGLTAKDITWTVQNTANWQSLFDYQSLAPKAEWRTSSFVLQAKDTAAKGTKFQIWFTGTGKLWLAEVRLEPIQDPSVGRWLDGLYLTRPVEWDDPYRFFGW